MDFLLGKLVIPKSTKDCFVIRPYSRTFITGISKQYSFEYDESALGHLISEDDFSQMIAVFNDSLMGMWPCNLVMSLGYIFSIITCGLSFLLPLICIADAEKNLQTKIAYYNKYRLGYMGLEV